MSTGEKRVTVLARVKAKPGTEERLRAALLQLVAPSRAEAACINYDLHQSADDPTEFMFYENWASRAGLDAHFEAPHLAEFDALAEELLAAPVEITLWERISPEEGSETDGR